MKKSDSDSSVASFYPSSVDSFVGFRVLVLIHHRSSLISLPMKGWWSLDTTWDSQRTILPNRKSAWLFLDLFFVFWILIWMLIWFCSLWMLRFTSCLLLWKSGCGYGDEGWWWPKRRGFSGERSSNFCRFSRSRFRGISRSDISIFRNRNLKVCDERWNCNVFSTCWRHNNRPNNYGLFDWLIFVGQDAK